MEQLVIAMAESNHAGAQLKKDGKEAISKLKATIEEVLTMRVGERLQRGEEPNEGERLGTITTPMATDSYADKVKKSILSVHATAVARAKTQKRRIRLTKAMGMVGEGLSDLSEKQLVEKANLALGLMEAGEENRLEAAQFVGASKERSAGGVTYELNSSQAVDWLKGKDTMANFLSNMGLTTDYKEQMYEVVMDWVPVSLKVKHTGSWRAVEQVSRLRASAITEVCWIKPTHLRAAGQKTVIAVFKMATWEDANQVIGGGLYVEGKKVWGRKQIQEPRRCLKCQCFSKHKAAECHSIHDTCRRCSNQHRTNLCDKPNKDVLVCSNCKAAKNDCHTGHGVADRRCLIFIDRMIKMNKTRNKNKYKYYCTSNPATCKFADSCEQETPNTEIHGAKEMIKDTLK